jgi:hypothetical protein
MYGVRRSNFSTFPALKVRTVGKRRLRTSQKHPYWRRRRSSGAARGRSRFGWPPGCRGKWFFLVHFVHTPCLAMLCTSSESPAPDASIAALFARIGLREHVFGPSVTVHQMTSLLLWAPLWTRVELSTCARAPHTTPVGCNASVTCWRSSASTYAGEARETRRILHCVCTRMGTILALIAFTRIRSLRGA